MSGDNFCIIPRHTFSKGWAKTPNLSFERWGEIFQDEVMTATLIYRIIYQTHIVNMNGSSYRMKETKEWLETQDSD